MENNIKILNEDYNIRFYDTDLNGNISVKSIFNYIQEIAINHANKLGFGIEYIIKTGNTWVLSNLNVKIISLPKHNEIVKIKTYIPYAGNIKAYRNFIIRNEKDNILCEAKGMWYLINIKTKKPVLVYDIMKDYFTTDLDGILKNDKIPIENNYTYQKEFQVRLSDIDINKHVNNTSYTEWIIETIPYDFLSSNDIKEIDIAFRKESFYGDTIISYCEKSNTNEFTHKLISKNENEVVCLAKTTFDKKS